jgi:serine/threonine protein kinase
MTGSVQRTDISASRLSCLSLAPHVRRYLILDILGQGTFGQVVKCQNMKTHEIVAVKVVKNKPAYFNQSMMEVTILEMVRDIVL